MYMQNAFKVNENILIFANLQMKKKTNKQTSKQKKKPRDLFIE